MSSRQRSDLRRRSIGRRLVACLASVLATGLVPATHTGRTGVAEAAGMLARAQAPASPADLPPLDRLLPSPGPAGPDLSKLLPQPGAPSAPLPDILPQPVKDLLAQLSPPPGVPAAPGLASEPPPFWGLGSWVDLYDYGNAGNLTPESIVDEMSARGVRTVYVETARWSSPADIVDPGALGGFVQRAHDHGMKVVGWYMPGFADLDLDIRRSMAVLSYRSPRGDHLDGLAPDIEDRAAVGGSRDRWNDGVVAYSQRLRAAVPPGTVLAAIVPDAKNNERAPSRWAGFPWPEIARDYDVVMPMAYWSVAKPIRNCLNIQMDAAAYTREVMDKTLRLMGTTRPVHIIGGIADCVTPQEAIGYAQAAKDVGSIGGGLYDFQTNTLSAYRDPLWSAQTRLR